MSMWSYVGVYILGGITFVPTVVLLGYFLAPEAKKIQLEDALPEPHEQLSEQMLGPVQASAWFQISPYFVNLGEDDEFALSKVRARQQLRNNLDEKVPPKTTLAKLQKYWGTVRGHVMHVWSDETCSKRISSLNLQDFVVTLWPQGAEDYELFYKKYPICLVSRTAKDGLVALDMHPNDPPSSAHYIYVDNPCQKEDLYFALISGSRTLQADSSLGPRDPYIMAQPIDLDQEDVHELLNRIYSGDETPQTQWINALLGRLFLAVKKSRQLDEYVRNKIVYKLTKVKPSFIGDIDVQNVHIGSSLPYFDDIHLKSFSVDGNMMLEGDINYSGGFSLDIAFSCFVNVPGIMSTEVKCVLAVKLLSLKGKLVVRVKPSPSSHLWYSFKEMPEMDLKIEPTVMQRQVSYSFITNALKSMIMDALKESLVLPFMDDIPFCDTSDEFYRGGIWDAALRPTKVVWDKREKRESFSFEHSVVVGGDNASVHSAASAEDHGGVAATATGSASRPIAKFWNNLIRRKDTTEAATVAKEAVQQPEHTMTANIVENEAAVEVPTPKSSASSTNSTATTSTTAVTPASVHGVQSGIYLPPKTFAARRPVPGVVTATNAESFDPVKESAATPTTSVQRPQAPGTHAQPTLRASRSLQQLSRVTSAASSRRAQHSPSSSLSGISTSSRQSAMSQRRTVRLENLQPEPQPRH